MTPKKIGQKLRTFMLYVLLGFIKCIKLDMKC